MMTLARVSRWEYFFSDLAKTSLMMVWTAHSRSPPVLCVLRAQADRALPRSATASMLTFVAVILPLIAAMSEIVLLAGI